MEDRDTVVNRPGDAEPTFYGRLPPVGLPAFAAAARDRLRGLLAYLGASVRVCATANARAATLRREMRRVSKARRRSQFELGGGVYARDAAAAASLVERMRALTERLAGCAKELRCVVDGSRAALAEERLAIQPTQARRAVRG